MSKFTSVAAYVVKKVWLLLAILLVLFALTLSAARYALPHIDDNKHLIENYINDRYGVNLNIGSVHAVWQRAGPSIVLNSVSLHQNSASPVALNIRQIYVEVDFWQSVTQRLISSPRFELRGLALHVDADRLGSGGKSDFPVVAALESLFLEQLQSFSLEEGVVSITHQEVETAFDIERLSWNNRGDRHQGLGEMKVTELASNSASFIIDITGRKEKFQGVFYAKAEDLDISPWVSGLLNTKRPLTESRANFKVWAHINNNAVESVQAELDSSLLEWGGENYSPIMTGILGGSVQALPHKDGWNVRVDQLTVSSNDEILVADVIGRVEKNGDVLVNTVKPVPINPFLSLAPVFMDDTGDDEVRGLNPKGQLATLQLQMRNRSVQLAAKVFDLSWSQSRGIPGLSGLDADIYWYKNSGAVYLKSSNTMLASDKVIRENLAINEFSASVYAYQTQQAGETQWLVSANDIVFDTDKLDISPSFSVNLTTGITDIYASVAPLSLDGISDLFPSNEKSKNTFEYLTRAFTGKGEIERARILWHGKGQDFPFNDNQGVFQAYVDIKGSEFAFARQWPALKELDLSLYFENDALTMYSPNGQLGNMAITDMRAVIPRLHSSSTLTINATGSGDGKSLTALMNQSNLADSLGKLLSNDVTVEGALAADLQLDIPLSSGKQVRAQGVATLTGNKVYVSSTKMQFDNTQGKIAFDNANIDADAISADLLGQPVALSFTGRQQDAYTLNLNMQGLWHVHPLAERINPEFVEYVDGETQWNSDVTLTIDKQDFRYDATVTADLAATQSLLPQPFDSLVGNALPLYVHSSGDKSVSTVDASLGENIRFEGVLPHQEMQFSRAHLALGATELSNRGTGFSIAANLPYADGLAWFATLQTLLGKQPSAKTEGGKPNIFPSPSRIFVTTERLEIAGHSLYDVALTARQQSADWLMNIDAKNARGTVRINRDIMSEGIDINADYFSLTKPVDGLASETENTKKTTAASDEAPQLDPIDIPPVYFYCQQCNVYNVELGEVRLDTVKTPNGIKVRQLATRSDEAIINASGLWAHDGERTLTQLNGKLESPDVGQMLKQFGVSSGIKDSSAEVDFNLSWPASPLDFNLAKVQGDVAWSLSDGYLTELSDKGSRIFTLFSLNSLVRKLSLDFRDVFAQGFFYDDMQGTLSIADGRAFTDDTEIDGGAGEIEINGYTNLESGALNYNVSFAPNVTGNLPFLVYFLATPPTALAALAIDQVLTSAKVISNVNYRVTGTISDPQFDEVERNSKDITLPAQTTPETEPLGDRPLTKDDVRRIKMEVIDG